MATAKPGRSAVDDFGLSCVVPTTEQRVPLRVAGGSMERSDRWGAARHSVVPNVPCACGWPGADGALYLDLADDQWRAVEVTPTGWQIVSAPPVRFRRTPGLLALPAPQRGGSILALQSLLNLASYDDFVLVIAWLLAALRPSGPY